MPLLNNRPVERRVTCPSSMRGLDSLDAEKQYFYYPLTNEMFSDYTEYVNRVILYKQQIWTCKYTNKSRLTFEEALRCERKFLYRLIHDQFNRHILKPICELVRTMNVVLSTNLNLSVVAEDMFNRYTSQFLDGEEVMCQFTLNQPLTLVRVLRLEDRANGLYRVKIIQQNDDELDEQLNIFDSSQNPCHTVHSDCLFRFGEDNITIASLTEWLRRWTVRSTATKRLELRPELVEYYLLNDFSDSQFNLTQIKNDVAAIPEALRATMRGRIQGAANGGSAIISPASPLLGSITSGSNITGSRSSRSATNGRPKQHADRKYPVQIPFDPTNMKKERIPNQENLYIVLPQHLIPSALEVWNFCFAFREFLECSPFPFYDLQQALLFRHDEDKAEDPSPLLHSVLSSLLVYLLTRDRTAIGKNEIHKIIQRMKKKFNELIDSENGDASEKFMDMNARSASSINDAIFKLCDNWKHLSCIVLKEYWSLYVLSHIEEEEYLKEQYSFDEGKFFELGAKERLFVLRLLVEQCLQLQITRQFMKIKIMNTRKQKQTAAYAEEFSAGGLVPCRLVSLGRDRFNNSYWFFPGYAGCIFVEKAVFESEVNEANEEMRNNLSRGSPKALQYGIIASERQFNKLISWLDTSESVEKRLKSKLSKNESAICKAFKHMTLMSTLGDSDDIKQQLSQRRRDLEEKAAKLNEDESDEEKEDEAGEAEEAEEEETDAVDDESESGSDVKQEAPPTTTRSSTVTRRRRNTSGMKKEESVANGAAESNNERRSRRLVQKRKVEVLDVKEEPKKKARETTKRIGANSTVAANRRTKTESNSNGALVKRKSPEDLQSSIYPKFLSINSHKFYINEYDFAFLTMADEGSSGEANTSTPESHHELEEDEDENPSVLTPPSGDAAENGDEEVDEDEDQNRTEDE